MPLVVLYRTRLLRCGVVQWSNQYLEDLGVRYSERLFGVVFMKMYNFLGRGLANTDRAAIVLFFLGAAQRLSHGFGSSSYTHASWSIYPFSFAVMEDT
jgi:hypothetical protein